MSETTRKTGGCLCGAVRFTVDLSGQEVGVCHCSMCRRWAGGPYPYISLDCAEQVSFDGSDNITRYRSSDWAERGFCRICGSSLFYRLVENGHYAIPAGAFDDQTGFHLSTEMFIDDKPDYYAFAGDTRKMTGAEVMAMAGSGSSAG